MTLVCFGWFWNCDMLIHWSAIIRLQMDNSFPSFLNNRPSVLLTELCHAISWQWVNTTNRCHWWEIELQSNDNKSASIIIIVNNNDVLKVEAMNDEKWNFCQRDPILSEHRTRTGQQINDDCRRTDGYTV